MTAKNYFIKSGNCFEKKLINLLKASGEWEIVTKAYMIGYFNLLSNIKCILLEKSWFFKYCENNNLCSKNLKRHPHGCNEPDCVLIINSNIYILEFKFQKRAGSVAEKLQTGFFKESYFRKLFWPKYKVFYIYILAPWFRNHCEFELSFLKEKNILYVFSDTEWITSLFEFIKKSS